MILLPSLDTRSWEQMVEEGRRELPRLDSRWTEYNASDPGITALEALAWITETALYRADRTPPALQRSFLRLLGFAQAEAGVATTVLSLNLTAPGPAIAVPAGLQIGAGGTVFETAAAVTVSPAGLSAVLVDAGDSTAVTAAGAGTFLPLGSTPRPGAALYLGFDAPLGTAGTPVRIHFWGEGFPGDAALIDAIDAERRAWGTACRSRCEPQRPVAMPLDWRRHYSALVVWEYRAGGGSWIALGNVGDATRALTLTGALDFDAPPTAGPLAHVPGGPVPGLFFLRCRLAAGGYDRAPRLVRLAVNAVPARHAARRPETRLGLSNGAALEAFWLPEAPVAPGSVRLRLRLNGADDFTWSARADHDLSGPFDRHVVLEGRTGRLTTGDGRQGVPLPAGAEVFASYALGGGTAGNLAAGTLGMVQANDHNAALVGDPAALGAAVEIAQPMPAIGGAARESVGDARARAILTLEASDKAVTAADFERHALATPGVPLARARAVPGLHPLMPSVFAAGCVGVVILPDEAGPAPEPSAALRQTVARWLERRRLITTEVHVLGPVYRDLSVAATLHLLRGTQAEAVRAAAAAALDALFHPLTGGEDGTGWPPGADVHATDVMAHLEALDGVDGVTGVRFAVGDPPCRFCDTVPLCPGELIRVQPHILTTLTPPGAVQAKGPDDDCC